MNTVRERVLMDVGHSLKAFPWNEHRDLINITVPVNYFLDSEENESAADFCEVIAIIDRRWLFNCLIADYGCTTDEDCRNYLLNEYTIEDSGPWFDEANMQNKIATVIFN